MLDYNFKGFIKGSMQKMNEQQLKVYDSYYFKTNKLLLQILGLWPYTSRNQKLWRRLLVIIIVVSPIQPLFYGMEIWCGRMPGACYENIVGVAYVISVSAKFGVAILYETKIERLYVMLADNWIKLSDPEERAILKKFAKIAKFKSFLYICFLLVAVVAFTQFSLVNPALDILIPLNKSRPKLFVTKAEFKGIDQEEYFWLLYVGYTILGATTVAVIVTVDTTYSMIVHQSLALFSIIQFLDVIESSFRLCMLFVIILCVFGVSVQLVTILEYMNEPLYFIRSVLFGIGVFIHLFYIVETGQAVEHQTFDLFFQIYEIDWFRFSKQSSSLLRFMMLRCTKPCTLTAGGLWILNFEHYAAIVGKFLSYSTVAISLQE